MYLKVALPVSLYQTFIYELDSEIDRDTVVGRRVLVDFRNKRYYGFVTETVDSIPENLKIKKVLHIDEFNTFTKTEIKIIESISDYYLSPIGLTIYYFIPNYLKGKNIDDDMSDKVYRLNEDIDISTKLSSSQKKLLDLVAELGEVSFLQLKLCGLKKNTIKSLVKQGVLVEYKFNQSEASLKQKKGILKVDHQKISSKINVLSFISDKKRFYKLLGYIKDAVEKKCSVLILFPSIQTLKLYYEILSEYFSNIKIYHDGISAKKQYEVWQSCQRENSIILGTLSSLLIPAKDLKYIFVELEHSESYRSLVTPKFDARRVAYLVGKYKSASVIYSDRLPSLEVYLLIKNKKAKLLSDLGYNQKQIEIRKFENIKKTLKSIQKIISTSNSVLIITNKSYYASFIYCERCGFEWLCEKCGVPLKLIVEETEKVLKCPECGKIYPYSKHCPDCEHPLTEGGFGSQKILSYLKPLVDISLYEDEKATQVKVVSSLEGKLFFSKYDTIINIYPDFIKNLDRYDCQELFFRSVITPLYIDANRYILFTNIQKDSNLYRVLSGVNDINSLYEEEIKVRQKYGYPPVKKYIKVEFFSNKENHIKSIKDFIRKYYKEDEIFFEFLDKNYYKVVLENKNKIHIKAVYERFSNFGKITIEVNPKNI